MTVALRPSTSKQRRPLTRLIGVDGVGYTLQQIATRLDITLEEAKARVRRARRQEKPATWAGLSESQASPTQKQGTP